MNKLTYRNTIMTQTTSLSYHVSYLSNPSFIGLACAAATGATTYEPATASPGAKDKSDRAYIGYASSASAFSYSC